MPAPSRRHTNQDFASSMSLLLAEIGFAGIMLYLFIGNVGDRFEKGVSEQLPIYRYEVSTDTIFLPASHVLHLELPVGGDVYCEGKRIKLEQLPKLVERHLYRAIGKDTIFFVSLRTERAAAYSVYLAVKDIVLAQQRDYLNELSLQSFREPYSEDMPFYQRKLLGQKQCLEMMEQLPDADEDRLQVVYRRI
jgi:hypothetical protein